MTPAETSIEHLVLWAAAISALISVGSALWTIFSGPSRKNAGRIDTIGARLDTEIDAVKGRLDRHEARLASIEQTVGGLPARDDVHGLQIALTEIRGDLKTMQATMEGNNHIMSRLEAMVSRHDDHLLKK